MNCNPTLTADEFRTVHNTLCELRSLAGRMYHSMIKVDEVEKIIGQFESSLKGAYEQDNQAFDSKWREYDHWREHYGLKTTWSIYSVNNMTCCHPFKDAEYVVYDAHWGDGGEVVRRIEGNDWNSLYRAADACIQASGDSHHCFIESFTVMEDKPGHLKLHTGS